LDTIQSRKLRGRRKLLSSTSDSSPMDPRFQSVRPSSMFRNLQGITRYRAAMTFVGHSISYSTASRRQVKVCSQRNKIGGRRVRYTRQLMLREVLKGRRVRYTRQLMLREVLKGRRVRYTRQLMLWEVLKGRRVRYTRQLMLREVLKGRRVRYTRQLMLWEVLKGRRVHNNLEIN